MARSDPIVDAATFPFEGVRLAATYQAALAVVAAAMVVLPLVYIALIGLVGYGLWYHATENVSILAAEGGVQGRVLAYAGPIVAGLVAIFFMVKPLFAPRVPPPPARTLDPADEPRLHAFVASLCRTLGAPVPRRIDVDMQVNASASFQRGWRSLFGSDLVLTIGLPLAGGLRLDELTGILAHEFGHFTQAAAMRLTYVIQSVNRWFARVVYERDEWDLTLEDQARSHGSGLVQLVLQASRLFVWLSRRILWVLMQVGRAVSGFMSRQMEFNADQYQVRAVGTQTYRDTHLRVHLLAAAQTNAEQRLGGLWRERRLVDDLAHFVADTADSASEDTRRDIEDHALKSRTGWLDTHPSTAARIAHASRPAVDGAFTLAQPAAELFSDFPALCRRESLALYRDRIDSTVGPDNLVSVQSLAAQTRQDQEAGAALSALLRGRGQLMNTGVFAVGVAAAPAEERAGRESLEASRAALDELLPGLDDALAAHHRIDGAIGRHGIAIRLADAGVRFKPADLELSTRDPAELRRASKALLAELETVAASLRPAGDAVVAHVVNACRLARTPAIAGRLNAARDVPGRLPGIDAAMAAYRAAAPAFESVRRLAFEFGVILQSASGRDEDEAFQSEARRLIDDLYAGLKEVAERVDATPYPYAWEGGPGSMIDYLFADRPAPNASVGGAAMRFLDAWQTLYVRMWADLALLESEVDGALRSPP